MNRFIQIHLLTSYPPANLNRDDQGRPKTARMGGVERLRVSSQSLKRHWRTSELFQSALSGHLGTRTKLFGVEIFLYFMKSEVNFNKAIEWTTAILEQFGKTETPADLKKKKEEDKRKLQEAQIKKWRAWDQEHLGIAQFPIEKLNALISVELAQLVFISPEEKVLVFELADKLISGEIEKISRKDTDVLRDTTSAIDVALFGRMLANNTVKNIEAACQVAHALSVHPVVIEDDYFTAVDDLNNKAIDSGSSRAFRILCQLISAKYLRARLGVLQSESPIATMSYSNSEWALSIS